MRRFSSFAVKVQVSYELLIPTDNGLSAKVYAAILTVAYVTFDCFVTTDICGSHCHLAQGNNKYDLLQRYGLGKNFNG